MKNPQCLELYLTLNSKQRQGFKKYLASPLFNKNQKLSLCLEKIDEFRSSDITVLKQELFRFLHPGESFTDVKLRLLFSELMKHLKNFIFIDEKQDDQLEKELSFIRFLRKGKLINLFENEASSFRKQLTGNKRWNPDVYEYRFRLDMELLSYESFKNRFSYFDFKESSEILEISSMLKRLRVYLEQLAHESIGATSLEYPMIQAWVDHAESKDWSRHPEMQIYLLALKMYQFPEQDHFFIEYLNMIRQFENDFDFERGRQIYLTALNYCIRKINQNDTSYFHQTLSLFQHCVRHGWILDYGVMSSLTYKNIIALCIRMNDLDLAIRLLEEYKNLVNPKDRNTIYHFNLAKIYKEQGEYSKALYLLNTSVFKDPLIELNARVEMIKIYYEIHEVELMYNQIHATKNLIKRSKKLGYHREYYTNFLQTANRLFSTRQLNKSEKETWLNSIKSDNRLIDKNWLYTMVDKIKSSEVLVS
jgi:tetratricopeptide (TPR) repeat protein